MTVNELKKFATDVRIETVKCLEARTFGHIGGCLSIADVLTVLYNGELKNIDPADPKKLDRDMLVVSKGHAGPAVFATLALKGYFPLDWLPTLCEGGTRLPSHCDRIRTPGIDASTGSLGQGLSLANGFAHAAKIKNLKNRIYCLMGDGEIQEGQVWEASMFAGHRKLDNLVVMVDNNGLQIDGKIEDVCSPYPIGDKFKAFNFHVIENVDAHDFDAIRAAFEEAKATKGMPTAIIFKSVKGKGVSFMENNAGWHGKAPNDEEYETAMAELEKAGEALCQK